MSWPDDGTGLVNVKRVSELCASTWGLYTTVTDNLENFPRPAGRDPAGRRFARDRRRTYAAAAVRPGGGAESGGWRRRAKIGRRMKWYQTPDEV